MTASEILAQLKGLGEEGYKRVIMKHGVPEPLYGVKIEELKKIAKKFKGGDHALSLELFNSGIYDAMYLAGLVAVPEQMSEHELELWATRANSPAIREYTVAWVAAEGPHALKKAIQWIDSPDIELQSIGWSVLSSLVTITNDEDLDIPLLSDLLNKVQTIIHASANRVKLAMNGFVIAVGTSVQPLHEAAIEAAKKIGKVTADMGDTACKIPDSLLYIDKVVQKGQVGKKKKSARCL